jgi:hypothetical protein
LYYPTTLVVGIKKGIVNYKTTNGIFALRKHIETLHWHVWSEWQEQEKDGTTKATFKKEVQTHPTNYFFLF